MKKKQRGPKIDPCGTPQVRQTRRKKSIIGYLVGYNFDYYCCFVKMIHCIERMYISNISKKTKVFVASRNKYLAYLLKRYFLRDCVFYYR